jgi:DNA-directed RNA polymerase subunit alpha
MFESSISKVTVLEAAGNYGHFLAEPLEPGFGITLGNALRRTLLSSLPGAAVIWVRIDGAQHEFSSIPNVKEDIIEFLLNVKQLRICPLSHQAGRLFLEVTGEGKVHAADIKPSADFKIANPELYLATVDSSEAKFSVEFNVELGKGYVPAKSSDGLPIGALPTDAIFSPVRKVNFSVEPVRPGQEGSPEKLSLEVWTDGTISPGEAINQSANILISQFSSFRELAPVETGREGPSALPKQYSTPLEELNLSVRAYNSLKRAGIDTLGQLLERSENGLPQLPGLGAKSRGEVEEMLANLGFPIVSQKKKKGVEILQGMKEGNIE